MGQYSQWLYYREVDRQLQAQLESLERELAQLQERTQTNEQNGQEPEACLQDDNKIILALGAINRATATAGLAPTSLHGLPNGQNGQISSTEDTPNLHSQGSESIEGVPPLPAVRLLGTQSRLPADNKRRGTPTESAASGFYEKNQGQHGESISSALFSWSNLPNFGPQEVADGPQETPAGNDVPFTPFDRPLPPVPQNEMALLPEDMGSFIDQRTITDPRIELPWWFRNIAAASRAANSPNSPTDQESIRTNRLVQRWLERWGRLSTDSPQQPGEKPS